LTIGSLGGGDIALQGRHHFLVIGVEYRGAEQSSGGLIGFDSAAVVHVAIGEDHHAFEGFGFDPTGAVEPPEGFDHLVDEEGFFVGVGIERDVGLQLEIVALFLDFAVNDEARRVQAVGEAVLAGDGFARLGPGSGGVSGVLTVALAEIALGGGVLFELFEGLAHDVGDGAEVGRFLRRGHWLAPDAWENGKARLAGLGAAGFSQLHDTLGVKGLGAFGEEERCEERRYFDALRGTASFNRLRATVRRVAAPSLAVQWIATRYAPRSAIASAPDGAPNCRARWLHGQFAVPGVVDRDFASSAGEYRHRGCRGRLEKREDALFRCAIPDRLRKRKRAVFGIRCFSPDAGFPSYRDPPPLFPT